ncbi:MAG TPA: FHA domain-containing protein [Polyangiaceae bacterium]|jgi:hypothetical protein|nr:FHA domain-containing protein [Polyangiaceae bacterium]
MSDANKKTARSFQCRDALWEKFEQMARELECSIDYLINDSMKQYLRQRGYGTAASMSIAPGPVAGGGAPPPLPSPPGMPPLPPTRGSVGPPPPPMAGARANTGGFPPPPPPPPTTVAQGRRGPPPPPPARSTSRAPPPPPPAQAAAPAAGRAAPPPLANANRPSQLYIYYMGERFQVTKERFIIGRGKQSSDLTIKDPNVSRQHAMVEYLNGQYYIVDMGSTNGVEYNGQRVQRRVINDGDTFRVCDHELRFALH